MGVVEELSLEETAYYERLRFRQVQRLIAFIKGVMIICIAGSTVYTCFGIGFGYKRLRDIDSWTRPSAEIADAAMLEGFNVFLMSLFLIFNLVGFVSVVTESFTLTTVYCFGTTVIFLLSFADEQPWPDSLIVKVALFVLLQLSLVFFFLMRKRRVSFWFGSLSSSWLEFDDNKLLIFNDDGSPLITIKGVMIAVLNGSPRYWLNVD